jgi:hypothetical protein
VLAPGQQVAPVWSAGAETPAGSPQQEAAIHALALELKGRVASASDQFLCMMESAREPDDG